MRIRKKHSERRIHPNLRSPRGPRDSATEGERQIISSDRVSSTISRDLYLVRVAREDLPLVHYSKSHSCTSIVLAAAHHLVVLRHQTSGKGISHKKLGFGQACVNSAEGGGTNVLASGDELAGCRWQHTWRWLTRRRSGATTCQSVAFSLRRPCTKKIYIITM
ncbi:unnamed protein product [Nesidiocoris tenuis]|uniref:Uncharacterized protein n=1 Tax=Nesidiocoris tenuis TaxID=355587 RepID=A0A6H5H9X7_9HEMI|nr:unnamed protein product [Nesidiocoris tenuis]